MRSSYWMTSLWDIDPQEVGGQETAGWEVMAWYFVFVDAFLHYNCGHYLAFCVVFCFRLTQYTH